MDFVVGDIVKHKSEFGRAIAQVTEIVDDCVIIKYLTPPFIPVKLPQYLFIKWYKKVSKLEQYLLEYST
jgi:hypothetical protein